MGMLLVLVTFGLWSVLAIAVPFWIAGMVDRE